MIGLLGRPFLQDTLDKATPHRPFASVAARSGLARGINVTTTVQSSRSNVVAILQERYSYVLAVLGSPNGTATLRKLELAYHDCVVARHP